jgi:hypothetical protein
MTGMCVGIFGLYVRLGETTELVYFGLNMIHSILMCNTMSSSIHKYHQCHMRLIIHLNSLWNPML